MHHLVDGPASHRTVTEEAQEEAATQPQARKVMPDGITNMPVRGVEPQASNTPSADKLRDQKAVDAAILAKRLLELESRNAEITAAANAERHDREHRHPHAHARGHHAHDPDLVRVAVQEDAVAQLLGSLPYRGPVVDQALVAHAQVANDTAEIEDGYNPGDYRPDEDEASSVAPRPAHYEGLTPS